MCAPRSLAANRAPLPRRWSRRTSTATSASTAARRSERGGTPCRGSARCDAADDASFRLGEWQEEGRRGGCRC
eukprot:gene19467-biopygen19047